MKRRDALVSIAAGVALPALRAQEHAHGALAPLPPQAPAKPVNLSEEDYKIVTRVVDLIIPRSDTPGAADVGVPMYVDEAMTHMPEVRTRLTPGLAALREVNFLTLDEPAQVALLTKWSTTPESSEKAFFSQMKNLAIDGYYTSKEGLTQELGWHGNTFLKEFPGCTHPEPSNAD